MTTAIQFPNIGIHLKDVGYGVSVFGFEIAYYGILIGLAVLIGVGITALEAWRTRQDAEEYVEMALYTVPIGIIGARLFYVIFDWQQFEGHILRIFHIREGGLAIYGGLAAGILTVVIVAFLKDSSASLMLDTASLGVLAGQAIGIWGNFFNRESFGEYTDSLLAMRLPMQALRATDVTERMRNHIEMIEEVRYVQVHPVFLYESLWCVILFVILLFYKNNKRFDGEIFWLYLGGYSLGRIWLEGLRTDSLLIPGTELAVSQILAAVFVILSVLMIVYQRRDTERNRMRRMNERQQKKRRNRKNRDRMFS